MVSTFSSRCVMFCVDVLYGVFCVCCCVRPDCVVVVRVLGDVG